MNSTPSTPSSSTGRHTFITTTCSLLVLLIAGWQLLDLNSLPAYCVCISILCNMATIEWSLRLEETKDRCHRWLILLLGLPYPWLLGFDALKAFTVSVLGCAYRSGGQYAYLDPWTIATAFIGLIAMTALLWETTRTTSPEKSLVSIATDLLVSIVPVWFFSWGIAALYNANPAPEWPLSIKIILISLSVNAAAWLISRCRSRRIHNPSIPDSPPSLRQTWQGFISSWLLVSVVWIIITAAKTSFFSLDTDYPPPPRLEILHSLLGQSVSILISVLAIAAMTSCGNLVFNILNRSIGLTCNRSLLPGLPGFVPLLCGPAFSLAGWQLLITSEYLFHYIFS